MVELKCRGTIVGSAALGAPNNNEIIRSNDNVQGANTCHAEASPKHLRTDYIANKALIAEILRCAQNDSCFYILRITAAADHIRGAPRAALPTFM